METIIATGKDYDASGNEIDQLGHVIPEQPKKRNAKSYKTELKKSQLKERRMTIIAMLGWSLALVEMAILIVVFTGS